MRLRGYLGRISNRNDLICHWALFRVLHYINGDALWLTKHEFNYCWSSILQFALIIIIIYILLKQKRTSAKRVRRPEYLYSFGKRVIWDAGLVLHSLVFTRVFRWKISKSALHIVWIGKSNATAGRLYTPAHKKRKQFLFCIHPF